MPPTLPLPTLLCRLLRAALAWPAPPGFAVAFACHADGGFVATMESADGRRLDFEGRAGLEDARDLRRALDDLAARLAAGEGDGGLGCGADLLPDDAGFDGAFSIEDVLLMHQDP